MESTTRKIPLVIVIGAGITGLSTAFCLKQAGLRVKVLEKEPAVGGTMNSFVKDGFLVDTGPNSALETTPLVRTMLSDIGILNEQIYASPAAKNRYILRGGTLHPLPMNPIHFLKTRLFSTKAKLRLFIEPFIAPLPKEKEESVAEFVRRRIGREFLDYAINPFIAGVYAGNPDQLSVAHAVPKVFDLEQKYGSLIKGTIRGRKDRKKRLEKSKHIARLFSFRNGMEDFPTALARALGDSVQTSAVVSNIVLTNEGKTYSVSYSVNGTSRQDSADAVFFGIPAYDAAEYLQPFSRDLAETLCDIPYAGVAVVFFGASENQCRHPLDGFGFLVPEIEQRKILGTIWSSSLFPNRAPDDHIALTTFVGGTRQPELIDFNDAQLIKLVCGELRDIIGFTGKPSFTYIRRWSKAIPQYVMGHGNVLSALDAFEERFPGIFVGGNFRHGIGIGDCVKQAYIMAERIQNFLKKTAHSF